MRKVELTSDHQQEEFGKGQKETSVQMSYQPPRIRLSGIHLGATRKGPESERLARDNPETNPITIKPEAVSHIAEQSSWVPSPSCSLLRRPFPRKSLFCRHACLLRQSIYVRQELTLKPWRSPPSGSTSMLRGPSHCTKMFLPFLGGFQALQPPSLRLLLQVLTSPLIPDTGARDPHFATYCPAPNFWALSICSE